MTTCYNYIWQYVICHRSLEFLPKLLSLVAMATTVTVGGNCKYIMKYTVNRMRYIIQMIMRWKALSVKVT